MNKQKIAIYSLLAVLVLGGGAYTVKASSLFSWLRVEDKVADRIAGKVSTPPQEQEESLGAVTGPDFPNPNCTADLCTYVVSGNFNDVSTTIVSFASPWLKATSTGAGAEVVIFTDSGGNKFTSATTTVDLGRLDITGAATTSYQLACGASATGVGTPLPLYNALVTTSPAFASYIPTSSIGVVENNLTALQGAMIDSGTVAKITLNSAKPYMVCAVQATVASAFTNADNTFAGKYTFRTTLRR